MFTCKMPCSGPECTDCAGTRTDLGGRQALVRYMVKRWAPAHISIDNDALNDGV